MKLNEWVKSSTCPTSSACVEVMETEDGFLVRDSNDWDGPNLFFTHAEWEEFLAGVENNEFDGEQK